MHLCYISYTKHALMAENGRDFSKLLLSTESSNNHDLVFADKFEQFLFEHKFHETGLLSVRYFLTTFLLTIPSVGDYASEIGTTSFFKSDLEALTFVTVGESNELDNFEPNNLKVKAFSFRLESNDSSYVAVTENEVRDFMNYQSIIDGNRIILHEFSIRSDYSPIYKQNVFNVQTKQKNLTMISEHNKTKRRPFLKLVKKRDECKGENTNNYICAKQIPKIVPDEHFSFEENLFKDRTKPNLLKLLTNYLTSEPINGYNSQVGVTMSTEFLIRSVHAVVSGHFAEQLGIKSATTVDLEGHISNVIFKAYSNIPVVFSVCEKTNSRKQFNQRNFEISLPVNTDFICDEYISAQVACQNNECLWRTRDVSKRNYTQHPVSFNTYDWHHSRLMSYLNMLRQTVFSLMDAESKLSLLMLGHFLGDRDTDDGLKPLKIMLAPNRTDPTENYFTFAYIEDEFALVINIVEDSRLADVRKLCTTFRISGYQPKYTQVVNIISIKDGEDKVKPVNSNFTKMNVQFVPGYRISMQEEIHMVESVNISPRTAYMLKMPDWHLDLSCYLRFYRHCVSTLFSFLPKVYQTVQDLNTIMLGIFSQNYLTYRFGNSPETIVNVNGKFMSTKLVEGDYDEKSLETKLFEAQQIIQGIKVQPAFDLLYSVVFVNSIENPQNITKCSSSEHPEISNTTTCFHYILGKNENSKMYYHIDNNNKSIVSIKSVIKVESESSVDYKDTKKMTSEFPQLGHFQFSDRNYSEPQKCDRVNKIHNLLLYASMGENIMTYITQMPVIKQNKLFKIDYFFQESETPVSLPNNLRNYFFPKKHSPNCDSLKLFDNQTTIQTIFVALDEQWNTTNFNLSDLNDEVYSNFTSEPYIYTYIDRIWALQTQIGADKLSGSFNGNSKIRQITLPAIEARLKWVSGYWVFLYNVKESKILDHNAVNFNQKTPSCRNVEQAYLKNNATQTVFYCPDNHELAFNPILIQSADSMVSFEKNESFDRDTDLLFTLGGLDSIQCNLSNPAVIFVGNGTKNVQSSDKGDVIVLTDVSQTNGFIDALDGNDALILKSETANENSTTTKIVSDDSGTLVLKSSDDDLELVAMSVEHLVGVAGQPEALVWSCSLKSVDLQGGNKVAPDTIITMDSEKCDKNQTHLITVPKFTKVVHLAKQPSVTYKITGLESVELQLNVSNAFVRIEMNQSLVNLKNISLAVNESMASTFNLELLFQNTNTSPIKISALTNETKIYFQDGYRLEKTTNDMLRAIKDCSIPGANKESDTFPKEVLETFNKNRLIVVEQCPDKTESVVHAGLHVENGPAGCHLPQDYLLLENDPSKKSTTIVAQYDPKIHVVYRINKSHDTKNTMVTEVTVVRSDYYTSIFDLKRLTKPFESQENTNVEFELTKQDSKNYEIRVYAINSTTNENALVAKISMLIDTPCLPTTFIMTSKRIYQLSDKYPDALTKAVDTDIKHEKPQTGELILKRIYYPVADPDQSTGILIDNVQSASFYLDEEEIKKGGHKSGRNQGEDLLFCGRDDQTGFDAIFWK